MALVAANKNYDIYLTSTPPNQLRFRILNADKTFKIRVSMYYFSSNRIDVYANGTLIPSTNSYYQNGNMLLTDPSTNMGLYMPSFMNASGTNLFIKAESKVFFSMGGLEYIDLKIAPVLILRFGLPAITPEQFFDPKTIVANFAALLNISQSMIRQVQIVRASQRKRDTTSGLIYVSLQIYQNPVVLINNTELFETIVTSLEQIQANVTNKFTTGQLNQTAAALFNVTLESMFVQPVDLSNSSLVEINKIAKVVILTDPDKCREQSPCEVQPTILVLDQNVIFQFFLHIQSCA